jgi:pyruvate,water dikinase
MARNRPVDHPEAYDDFGDSPFVAVRSSATAEDLPDASFAGQQETFLNVDREELLDRVKRCWGSLFTQRAIYYRDEQGFNHEAVDIAVVVQRMVDAEKSGVIFTI